MLKGNLIKFPKADITLATFAILWLLISKFIILWSAIRLGFQIVPNNVSEVEHI